MAGPEELRIHISRALHLYSRHLARDGQAIPSGLRELALELAAASLREKPDLDPTSFAMPDSEPLLLTLQQVAGQLGVSRRTVERLASAGDLATVKVRGSRRVTPEAIADYLTATEAVRSRQEPPRPAARRLAG